MLEKDSSAADAAMDLQLLKTLTPLKSMTDSHLTELVQNCQPETVCRGQELFRPGDYDRHHVYLLHGEVELIDADGSVSQVKGRSSVLPLALAQPRQHKALATTDCSVLRVDSDRLDQLLAWSQIAEYLLLDVAYKREMDEDVAWITTLLRSNLFFKVPPVNVQAIVSSLTPVPVTAGQTILSQGDLGDCCYFIKEGEAAVTRSSGSADSEQQHLANIGIGRCFGEDALLNETVRNATVTMRTDGVLMRLQAKDFIRLLKAPPVARLTLVEWRQLLADQRGPSGERVVTIDVRTGDEYALGHLDEAVNIPLNLLRLKTRLLSRSARYVVYCDTGWRSTAAAHLLSQDGYDVNALESGLNGFDADERMALAGFTQDYVLREGSAVPGH